MDVTARYFLDKYEELSVLSISNKCRNTLVRNRDTGELAVKREMDDNAYNIYYRLKHLTNENIVNVLECFHYNDKCITFEEYVDGKRLDSVIAEKKLTLSQVITYSLGVCNALDSIHSQGIIHRDITPKNIIISKIGQVKLIDFDIARTEKEGASRDTEMWGTTGYAAPEQYGFGQTDERSDIYSLGILIKTMITGNCQATEEDIKKGLYGNSNAVIEKVISIIKKCTEIDRVNRYATVKELKDILKDVMPIKVQEQIEQTQVEDELPKITWKYILKTIPGFRHSNLFFALLASFVYIIMLVVFIEAGLEQPGNIFKKIYSMIVSVSSIVIPYAYLTNIGQIAERFPRHRFKTKTGRIIYQIFAFIGTGLFLCLIIGLTFEISEN